jgi:hypothetical protein
VETLEVGGTSVLSSQLTAGRRYLVSVVSGSVHFKQGGSTVTAASDDRFCTLHDTYPPAEIRCSGTNKDYLAFINAGSGTAIVDIHFA